MPKVKGGKGKWRKQVQKVEETGLITQAQAEYQTIVEEVRDYCQKARALRQQADELRRSVVPIIK
ncbi:hypothetical protein ACFW1P_33600 [Paenibacillus sp. NPDC058910]|uniref:hypothetical protein n=1 Tax=unclassified Paenibacillus TaxID=185978 RepID=UPI0036C000D5